MRSFTLNTKEETVLSCLPAPRGDDKAGEFKTLEDLAKAAFGDQKRGSAPKSKGNSWVRNSMRKLLSLKLVIHASGKSGKYARTRVSLKEIADKERDRLAAVEAKAKKKEAKKETKEAKEAKEGKPRASARKKPPAPAQAQAEA
jgi:hypothetical protein